MTPGSITRSGRSLGARRRLTLTRIFSGNSPPCARSLKPDPGGQNTWDLMAPWRRVTEELLGTCRLALTILAGTITGDEAVRWDAEELSIMDYKRYLREQPEWQTDNGRKMVDSR